MTNGFVDLNNPNRVPEGFADHRLGRVRSSRIGVNTRPANIRPAFAFEFDLRPSASCRAARRSSRSSARPAGAPIRRRGTGTSGSSRRVRSYLFGTADRKPADAGLHGADAPGCQADGAQLPARSVVAGDAHIRNMMIAATGIRGPTSTTRPSPATSRTRTSWLIPAYTLQFAVQRDLHRVTSATSTCAS